VAAVKPTGIPLEIRFHPLQSLPKQQKLQKSKDEVD